MDVVVIASLRFCSALLSFFETFIIIYVILSWLTAFKIINPYNRFIYIVQTMAYQTIEPLLSRIRRFVPSFGMVDLSPVILILLVHFLQDILDGFARKIALS